MGMGANAGAGWQKTQEAKQNRAKEVADRNMSTKPFPTIPK